MTKVIFYVAVLFSNMAFANVTGIWTGKLNINGKACKPTSIEITQTETSFRVYAAIDENGNHALECGPKSNQYYMWLEEQYFVKGNELWRYDAPMGLITEQNILGRDRLCNPTGCEYWDSIKINRLGENTISLWVDFDGAVLTGELLRE